MRGRPATSTAALDSISAAECVARAAHNDPALDVLLHQPWWEIDAGPLTDHARRRGWSQSSNQPHQRDGDPTARLPGQRLPIAELAPAGLVPPCWGGSSPADGTAMRCWARASTVGSAARRMALRCPQEGHGDPLTTLAAIPKRPRRGAAWPRPRLRQAASTTVAFSLIFCGVSS